MTHPSWAPHGAALRAFLAGREDAEIVVRGEDGEEERTPARVFFRGPEEFSSLEDAALPGARSGRGRRGGMPQPGPPGARSCGGGD